MTAGGQAALFGEVREFLAALAAASPLLVVLEDLHWADHASLDLLRVVGRFVPTAPMLVVEPTAPTKFPEQPSLPGVARLGSRSPSRTPGPPSVGR